MEKKTLGSESLSMNGDSTHCKGWASLCWKYAGSSIYPSNFSPGDGLNDMVYNIELPFRLCPVESFILEHPPINPTPTGNVVFTLIISFLHCDKSFSNWKTHVHFQVILL